jgi:hypothetical protein
MSTIPIFMALFAISFGVAWLLLKLGMHWQRPDTWGKRLAVLSGFAFIFVMLIVQNTTR